MTWLGLNYITKAAVDDYETCEGYATELAQALLDHGFKELKLERIVAVMNLANRASRHVVEKLGVAYEGLSQYQGQLVVKYTISSSGEATVQNTHL